VSRDTSQIGDRRLWLADRCPRCVHRAGVACRAGLAAAVLPDQPGRSRRSRAWRPAASASRPHAARLGARAPRARRGRRVWRALDRIATSVAVVRFTAGGGRPASVEVVAVAGDGAELGRWPPDESELADALAAARVGTLRELPVGSRPSPRHCAGASPSARSRSPAGAAHSPFAHTLAGAPRATGDTSRDKAARPSRCLNAVPGARDRCPRGLRPEARYCGKRCRQAASRARLALDRP
jgi:hypothetical protein